MTIRQRQDIEDSLRRLRRLFPHLDLAQLKGNSELLKQTGKHVTAIVRATDGLDELLQPRAARHRFLKEPERTASLVAALIAGAKAQGSGVYPADSLAELVATFAVEEDQPFWRDQPGMPIGLLRLTKRDGARGDWITMPPQESEACRLARERGVLIWEGLSAPGGGTDSLWRVVDTEWLATHEEIRAFVLEDWPGGQRCRFCRSHEPRSHELEMVGIVKVHGPCKPFWLAWLEIASSYDSQEAAAKADKAAHRLPRAKEPALPQITLERPTGEPPPLEFPTEGKA